MTRNLFRLKLKRLGYNFYQTDHEIAVFRPELGVLAVVDFNTYKIDYPEQLMPTGAVIRLIHEYLYSRH